MQHMNVASARAGRIELPLPRRPLVIGGKATRLVVRLLAERDGSLLLFEERIEPTPLTLEPLGLSRREAEVLSWVAHGKTNPEIATILAWIIHERTVSVAPCRELMICPLPRASEMSAFRADCRRDIGNQGGAD